MSLGSYNTVTVGNTATLIVAANNNRKGLIVFNNGSANLFIGPDTAVTTANSLPMIPLATFSQSGERDVYRGAIYGIVASSTNDVRYWEWI